MKLFFELIFAISITGTLPFCLYLIFSKIFQNKICASIQYILLKCILLCFLFPFSLIKSILISSATPHKIEEFMNQYIYLDNKIIQTSEGFFVNPGGNAYQYILPLWLLILIFLISYQIYHYLQFRHKAILHFQPDDKHQTEFVYLKTQINIRRRVSLLYCNGNVSPFTYGIFKPCVVLTPNVEEKDMTMAMKHELQHIKSFDLFFRILTFLTVLLHCWNPFIYLFSKEIYEVSELACDEKITSSLSDQEVRRYGYSIIQTASSFQPHTFIPQFSREKKRFIFRRMKHLSLRFTHRRQYANIILLAVCLVGFSIPVYACSSPLEYIGFDYESSDLKDIDWIYHEPLKADALKCPKDEDTFSSADEYFLLENGTILVPPSADLSKKALCDHSLKSAQRKTHRSDGKGGCTVTTYQVLVCTKCYATKSETFVSETRYGKCPH